MGGGTLNSSQIDCNSFYKKESCYLCTQQIISIPRIHLSESMEQVPLCPSEIQSLVESWQISASKLKK